MAKLKFLQIFTMFYMGFGFVAATTCVALPVYVSLKTDNILLEHRVKQLQRIVDKDLKLMERIKAAVESGADSVQVVETLEDWEWEILGLDYSWIPFQRRALNNLHWAQTLYGDKHNFTLELETKDVVRGMSIEADMIATYKIFEKQ